MSTKAAKEKLKSNSKIPEPVSVFEQTMKKLFMEPPFSKYTDDIVHNSDKLGWILEREDPDGRTMWFRLELEVDVNDPLNNKKWYWFMECYRYLDSELIRFPYMGVRFNSFRTITRLCFETWEQ